MTNGPETALEHKRKLLN